MERVEEPWGILARGVGRWEGSEEMPPAPWAPDGMKSTATMDVRLVLDGRGLSSDYVQSQAHGDEMRSHTLIRWHAEEEVFVLEFSSQASLEPMVLRGQRSGDSVVFQGPGPGGVPMRQTMTWTHDHLAVQSESPDEEGGWTTTFSGTYVPVEPTPAVGGIG